MSQILLAAFGTPAASPGTVPNILAWYKGSDFDAVTDGTDVSTWNDQSGNGNTQLAVGGAGDTPVVVRNAINTTMTAVKGTLSTEGLQRTSFGLSDINTWTVFAVINFTALPAGGSHNIFFGFDTQLSDGMFIGIEPSGAIEMLIPNVGGWLTNETISAATWYYIVIVDAAGTPSVYVNGTLFTWASTPGSNTNSPPSVFGLFRTNSGAGSRGNCDIAELAFYNASVSDPDRINNLQDYAIDRFGL